MATDDTKPLGKIELEKFADRSEHDTSIALSDFLPDAKSASADEFADRHGSHFLVRWLLDGAMAPPAPLGSAAWRKMTSVVPAGRGGVRPYGDRPQAETFYAYPLVVVANKALAVGRAHTCDVCISDMSVSTQHAEIELIDNRVTITDRSSTNGTVIANSAVEFGESAVAEDGRIVQFGSVQLTFLSAEKFVQFVLVMCGASR